jgi:hypothetical protein
MRKITIILILFQLIGCAKKPAIIIITRRPTRGAKPTILLLIKEEEKPTQKETPSLEPTKHTISGTLTEYWNSIKDCCRHISQSPVGSNRRNGTNRI